jgi:hypothetical protein
VPKDFGASDAQFTTSNYGGTTTTPRDEWAHVFKPEDAPPLSAGRDDNGKDLGMRDKIRWQTYRDGMLEKIKVAFHGLEWHAKAEALSQADIDKLELTDAELIGLRLYTGPMFTVYNTALRAMGNAEAPGIVPAYDANFGGLDARGRFATTIHMINHGVIKLARLSQGGLAIHRGLADMKLPSMFLEVNVDGVKGGVEFGFMSTTADKNVALQYSKGTAGAPRTLFTARTSLTSRGAYLGFLSQYPGEEEFLWAPLCAMEVLGDPVKEGGVLIFTLDFASNPTICAPTADAVAQLAKAAAVEEMRQAELESAAELAKIMTPDGFLDLSGLGGSVQSTSPHKLKRKKSGRSVTLPPGIGALPGLRVLDLSGNGEQLLGGLPEALWLLTSLEELRMQRCGLRVLPEGVGGLVGLKQLHLYGNVELGVLPESLWSLTGLEMLDLSECCFTVLPEGIGHLAGLKSLVLSGNVDLRALPEALCSLVRLEVLHMHHCGLQTLPVGVEGLVALKTLNLTDNVELQALPMRLGQLRNLETLRISCCPALKVLDVLKKKQGLPALLAHIAAQGDLELGHAN